MIKQIKEAGSVSSNDKVKRSLEQLQKMTENMFQAGAKWVELAINQDYAEAFVAEEEFKAKKTQYLALTASVQKMARSDLEISLDQIHTLSQQGIRINFIIFGLTVPVVLFLSVVTFLTIVKPLEKTVSFARRVAEGDVSQHLDINSQDELGIMSKSLNDMVRSVAQKSAVAESIARGDLTCDVLIASDRDALGLSLRKMVENLASMIRNVQTNAAQLAQSSDSMSGLSMQLAEGAETMSGQTADATASISDINSYAQNVAATSGKMSQNMAIVARTTERMSGAIIGNR